jgi:hypothetical protein
MTTRARLARLGWFLAAAFQILLPTVASVADARAEGESIRYASRIHIEAEGTLGCPAVHPEDCVVSRVLATGARTTRPVVLHIALVRVIEASAVVFERLADGASAPGDPPQRAPPTLS